jgi:hypothetical protein
MSRIALSGNLSGTGTFTLASPDSNSDRVLDLPDASGTVDAFASGTRMMFQQTAAPTGWTKDTTHDNKALRVVSGTVGSGGSVAFTTAFASQAVSGSVGSTTLTEAQMPSHTHLTGISTTQAGNYNAGSNTAQVSFSQTVTPTSATGGGGSHNHSFTGTAINLAVSYVDLIIATKN